MHSCAPLRRSHREAHRTDSSSLVNAFLQQRISRSGASLPGTRMQWLPQYEARRRARARGAAARGPRCSTGSMYASGQCPTSMCGDQLAAVVNPAHLVKIRGHSERPSGPTRRRKCGTSAHTCAHGPPRSSVGGVTGSEQYPVLCAGEHGPSYGSKSALYRCEMQSTLMKSAPAA